MENKDNVDNNNKDFSDNNGQNIKQSNVNQDLKKKGRCGICFGVGHNRRNCPQTLYQLVTIIFMINMNILMIMHMIMKISDIFYLKDAENEIEFIDHEANYTIADDNIDLQKEQSLVTHDYVSPGGSSYWIPVVSDHIKPRINSIVESYSTALSMYNNYASFAGFDLRLGLIRTTESDLSHNDICYAIGKRRKDSFRCECKVKIVCILVHGTNKYMVVEFVEQHNRELFGKDNMFLSRTKRKLGYYQEMFIHNLSKQNIGASRAHRLYTRLQGGSDIRGGLVSDFKNSMRNLNSYIGSRDAKFLFKVVQKKLNALFLADETAKYNYNAFGDIVSLDVTFSMNKEDGSSYSWLLRAFLKAFKKHPTLVLTDQDPTLNKVVNERFQILIILVFQMSVTSNNGVDTIIVLEKQKNISKMQPSSPVVDDKHEEYHYDCLIEDTKYMYTCMHFEHVDLLCRHIFCVFKFYSIKQIPKEYIMRRWHRDVIPTKLLKRRFSNSLLDANFDMNAIEFFLKVDRCVSFLSHDAAKLKSYLEELNKLEKSVELTNDVPDIENPSDIRNKGTGSHGKRLKKMVEKVCWKPKRKYLCKQMADYDKHNFPLKNNMMDR
uniref:Protein FAR1-RELATED SEQUENCE n=1 Tax=Lactuca sativa TaxID=4236 RepID=A0A9R1XHH5_LACSA|nr:hypothetical protein LSAT_V11C400212330 [Lactuca sativa]